ncbi:NAD(P)-dependent alcohol dehydrogenase [bacterium SCSIO 12741]|nr:NAD(P)-dependent alcohol dehydrogenase [bacterium SCSIO 12741]
MKAAVCTRYGSPEVIQVQEVAKPQPKDDQVLVKIKATTVSSGDARIRRADPAIIRLIFGFRGPRKSVLGVVVAGEVESVGKKVTKFKAGDQVFGTTGMSFGAHAEYQCIAENGTLALMPENMSYQEAAALPFGGTAAAHFLRKANIQKGQHVLIYGASGAIGTIAIQLAKELGAEVTGVCSGRNTKLAKSLGADHVIDYTQEDFSENGVQYDVVLETVGKCTFSQVRKACKKDGVILLASAGLGMTLRGAFSAPLGGHKVISGVIEETEKDMNWFKELFAAGRLKAVIDEVYSLEDIAQAHARVDSGRKVGNVVVGVG